MQRFAILLPVLGLAACGQATPGGTAAASAFTPGHYDMTYTVTKVETPAMPEAAKTVMETMGEPTTTPLCITPEQAQKPAASIFAGQGGDCTYDHLTMAAGVIDVTTTCHADGATAVMKGRFGADGFRLVARNEARSPGPVGRMIMTATIDAKRTGACTGQEPS